MDGAADDGERWPFGGEEANLKGFLGTEGTPWMEDRAWATLAAVLGLRLRARARFSMLESEEGESGSSEMAELGDGARLAAAERVMGAK